MVKSCIKCKKFLSPLDLHRSLHRFPNRIKNPSLYQKWVQFVGREVSNSDSLCSDHFGPKDYKNLEKRRLHNNAVPSENAIGMFQYSHHKSPPSLERTGMQHDNVNKIIGFLVIPPPNSKRMILDLTSPSVETSALQQHHDDNNSENTSEHELPTASGTGFQTKSVRKRIRKVGGMSRKQFTSDEDWEDYKNKHTKLLNQMYVLNKKLARKGESMKKMATLIAELKKQHVNKSAEFL